MRDMIRAEVAELLAKLNVEGQIGSLDNSSGLEMAEVMVRLNKIEAKLDSLTLPLDKHPSKDNMTIINSMVDGLFNKHEMEKACAFEQNAKPCDHCSMCSSRGF